MNTRHYGLVVDGDYGPKCRAALLQFQQLRDLDRTAVLTAADYLAAFYAPRVGPT